MKLLHRLLCRVCRSNPRSSPNCDQRRRAPLQMEVLEERLTPNNRIIVPLDAPFDNIGRFRTLQAALTTPGLAAGDVIQIQPGALPGSITDANLDAALSATLGNLTIRGDLTLPVEEIPAFAASDALSIDDPNFRLQNVQVRLVGGNLSVLDDDVKIINCRIVSDFALPAGTAALELGAKRTIILGSFIASTAGANSSRLIHITPMAASNHQIVRNTLVSVTTTWQQLLIYGDAAVLATVGDRITDNRLIGDSGPGTSLLTVGRLVDDVTIQGNAFQSENDDVAGIVVAPETQNIVIHDNRIQLKGGGLLMLGIYIVGGAAGTTTSAVVSGNQIINRLGIGLFVQQASAGGFVNVRVEGNRFVSNIGVSIGPGFGPGGGSVTGIDLGSSGPGSVGGNDFGWFTTPATNNSGAIVNLAAAAQGDIQARNNLFHATPETVVWDFLDDNTRGDVDTAGPHVPVAFAVGVGFATSAAANQAFAFNFIGSLLGAESGLYGAAAKGVHVAVGDVNGDYIPDVVTAPGAGVAARIRVIDGADGALTASFLAYPVSFKGGAFVAVGNVIDDAFSPGNEIIVTPGGGARLPLKVFNQAGTLLVKFKPFGARYNGPIYVAAGNVDGLGLDEMIVTRNNRQVRVMAGPGRVLNRFRAAGSGQPFVAAGDVTGDGRAEIILGEGAGRKVRVVQATGALIKVFNAFGPAFDGGVRVAVVDFNSSGLAEVLVGSGGKGRRAKRFNGLTGALLSTIDVLPPGAPGFFVGGYA